MKITSQPPGATVILNDEEVGVTPMKVSFLWYGDYDIILRKPGFETLRTHHRLQPPWHQYPPFDIIAETMIPAMITDEHELPTFTLTPAAAPNISEIVERAVRMRDETLYQAPE